jgi:uncharacterized protein YbjQ (UPF0145 family)
MEELLALGLQIVPFLLLMLIGFIVGTTIESNHYRDIRKREAKTRNLPAITFRRPPPSWQIQAVSLVHGNTVVSIDYFKRFLAGLRAMVGGKVTSYESLLDRARREALLRMKERALEGGFDAVVNVRLETARLANSSRNGQGTAGVEIFAFGTAVKLAS